MQIYSDPTHSIELYQGDVLDLYDTWDSPIVIVADGPYGVHGFPGDPPTTDDLDKWYEPHLRKWSERATAQTTLWFWGIELGWVKVHPLLEHFGWEYVSSHVWDKGIEHIAGNSNTKSLRQLPKVTEVCVQYVKKPVFLSGDKTMSMKEWLRAEWERTGLPFSKTNEACGVKNAATRKYFTKDWLWYAPPPDVFEKLSVYANRFGEEKRKPYFSIDGEHPLSARDWGKLRAKFYCPMGVTNVWRHSPVNGSERLKTKGKAVHLNQKPIKLMELIISTSSDPGDLVWEPFGGLCTAAVASHNLSRSCVSAEVDEGVYQLATERLRNHVSLRRFDF